MGFVLAITMAERLTTPSSATGAAGAAPARWGKGGGRKQGPCREVAEDLARIRFGGGVSLAASANVPCSRERRNARQVSTSRRAERVSKVCASAASLALEAFGDSCGLRRRFVLPDSGKWQSKRPTPNQSLQRTAGHGGQFPCPGFHPPGSVTACASHHEAPAQPAPSPPAAVLRRPAPGPPSLSLGSLSVARAS